MHVEDGGSLGIGFTIAHVTGSARLTSLCGQSRVSSNGTREALVNRCVSRVVLDIETSGAQVLCLGSESADMFVVTRNRITGSSWTVEVDWAKHLLMLGVAITVVSSRARDLHRSIRGTIVAVSTLDRISGSFGAIVTSRTGFTLIFVSCANCIRVRSRWTRVGIRSSFGTVVSLGALSSSDVGDSGDVAIVSFGALLAISQEDSLTIWVESTFRALVDVLVVDDHVSDGRTVVTHRALVNCTVTPLTDVSRLTPSAISHLSCTGHHRVSLIRAVDGENVALRTILSRLALLSSRVGDSGRAFRTVETGSAIVNDETSSAVLGGDAVDTGSASIVDVSSDWAIKLSLGAGVAD